MAIRFTSPSTRTTQQASGSPASITALPSSLSSRSAPTLPSASTTYEPFLRTILGKHFASHVLLPSLFVSWLVTVVWHTWEKDGVKGVWGVWGLLKCALGGSGAIGTALAGLLGWAVTSAVVGLVRRRYVQAHGSTSVSPHQTITKNATDQRYRVHLLVLLASSLAYGILHAFSVTVLSGGKAGLGLWAGSKKHPFHLNGRLIHLLVSQLIGASVYWARDVLKSRFLVRWMKDGELWSIAFPSLLVSLISVAFLSAAGTALSLLAFGTLHTVVLPIMYRLPVLHAFLRPFVAHFLRPTYTLTYLWTDLDVVIRASFLALSTQLCWETASTMFDVVFALSIEASTSSKDPVLYLTTGINSENPYLQFHALHELALFASSAEDSASAKRTALFSDSKHTPTLWASLVRRCLLLLGKDYQNFILRGKVPAPAPAPVAVPPPKEIKNVLHTPVRRENIYRIPRNSPLDKLSETLASDGPITKLLSEAPLPLPEPKAGLAAAEAEAIAKKLGTNIDVSSLSAFSVKDICLKAIERVFGSRGTEGEKEIKELKEWWTRERVSKAAMMYLPHREVDVLVVQILSNLVSKSLHEDPFGNVQRDISRILEALVRFMMAIESYLGELRNLAANENPPIAKDAYLAEVNEAGEWVDGLASELRTGIGLIVNTFGGGERLAKFRFPPEVAEVLQGFVDYASGS